MTTSANLYGRIPRREFERLAREKERTYNFIARLVLDQVPFERVEDQVQLIGKVRRRPQ